MKTAIKEDPKFESEIRDNPLRVLALNSTLSYTPAQSRYPFSTLSETASSLLNIRQGPDKKPVDFIEKFNQEKQLIKTQLGKKFLDVFVGNTVEFNASLDADERTRMENEAFT